MPKPPTIILLCALAGLAGCGILFGHRANPTEAQRLSKLAYPADAPIVDSLDIELQAEPGGNVRLVNRTPRRYEKAQVWINMQYVAVIDRVKIGSGNTLSLRHFVNQHKEPFPVGGLLTPDKAFPMIIAEMYDPQADQMHRLLVRATDELR